MIIDSGASGEWDLDIDLQLEFHSDGRSAHHYEALRTFKLATRMFDPDSDDASTACGYPPVSTVFSLYRQAHAHPIGTSFSFS